MCRFKGYVQFYIFSKLVFVSCLINNVYGKHDHKRDMHLSNEEIVNALKLNDLDDAHRRELMSMLYSQNTGLIRKMITPYINAGLEEADGMQEGYIALHKAINAYNPDGGTSFSTYFATWIRAIVGKLLINTSNVKRLPEHIYIKIQKYRLLCDTCRKEHDRDPTDAEIMEALNISERQLKRLYESMREADVISLSHQVEDGEGNSIDLIDTIADPKNVIDDVTNQISAEQDAERLWTAVENALTNKQAAVIRSRYRDREAVTTISKRAEVTPQQIYRLEKKAFKKLSSNREVCRIGRDYGYTGQIYKGGLRMFRETGASIVESAVIKKLENNYYV